MEKRRIRSEALLNSVCHAHNSGDKSGKKKGKQKKDQELFKCLFNRHNLKLAACWWRRQLAVPLLPLIKTFSDQAQRHCHRRHWRPPWCPWSSNRPRRCPLYPCSCAPAAPSACSRCARTCQSCPRQDICHPD